MGKQQTTTPGIDPYIGHWITVLRNDKRAIVSAASHAERAVKYLQAMQPAEQREAA